MYRRATVGGAPAPISSISKILSFANDQASVHEFATSPRGDFVKKAELAAGRLEPHSRHRQPCLNCLVLPRCVNVFVTGFVERRLNRNPSTSEATSRAVAIKIAVGPKKSPRARRASAESLPPAVNPSLSSFEACVLHEIAALAFFDDPLGA